MNALTAISDAKEIVGRRAYVLCSAPRTGSSLLCEALKGTGCAGRPEEYFDVHDENVAHWMRTLGMKSPAVYLDTIYDAGTTENGVFGLKLHWHQMPAVSRSAGGWATGFDVDQVLARAFPRRNYLWLRRRNKVAQAISYLRASKSAVWRVEHDSIRPKADAADLRFDAAEIEHHVDLVTRFDQQWEEWFRARRLPALVLIYEDFCSAYDATVRAVCRHIGVGDEGLRVVPPRFARQADAVSVEWEAEYRRLKAHPLKPTRVSAGDGNSRETARSSPAPKSEASKLIAYDLAAHQDVRLVTASGRRAWMDAMPHRAAHRCLPMVIANQHGWMMLAPYRVTAVWDGREGKDGIQVSAPPEGRTSVAASHFGSGILTFSGEFLFRTPVGTNLHVRGPANLPKDGISALEGIVETDWTEATFTMNWKFTRPGHQIVFEAGEPFAMLTPVRRGDIETFQPVIVPIGDNPELAAGYGQWSRARTQFNADLQAGQPEAIEAGWQRHYVRGETISQARTGSHQTKLTLKEFDDGRPGRSPVPT